MTRAVIRLSTIEQGPDQITILVEGVISGQSTGLLVCEGRRRLERHGCVAMDLSGVRECGEPGLEALGRLAAEGVQLRGASPFLAALLRRRGVVVARQPPGGDACDSL